MTTILFVCTGNLCRSPMAEGLLRKRFADEGLGEEYQVMSAGVRAVDGNNASGNAIIAMAERYIDITEHIAHTITAEDMARADLVLTMSERQKDILLQTWPQYAWKVHLLSEVVGKRQSIRDPYGSSLDKYVACADTLSRYIDEGIEQILQLV